MPRSSRSKSHKQSKHSSKEASAASTVREYSGSDEDVKLKEKSSNGGKEDGVSFRISKDSSVSGERRKHGKDLFTSHGNGDVSEEYTTSSKRREEKTHGGSDRWNGGSSDEKGVVVNIDNKDSSKGLTESKSKSSRRHDAESASIVVLEKDEGKSGSGNRGEKRKSEKESSRKESSQHKENKESKDKERGSERGRKGHSDKQETDSSSKQVENQSSRRGKETTEWPIEEGLRNPELEKELEKRMRRRGEASSDKDTKEGDERRLSSKRHKDEEGSRESRQKDEKHREDDKKSSRDSKHRNESERHNKHKDDKEKEKEKEKHREDKYNEDGHKYKDDEKEERIKDSKRKQDDEKEREYRHKERDVKDRDRDRDREKRSRDSKYKDLQKDHSIEPEAKRMKDDNSYDDRVSSRYKDDRDRKRGSNNEKDEGSEYRSRSSMKEQRSESEKRSGGKVESGSERVRGGSRYADMEVSRRRSSPSRDYHRGSKQEENKHRGHTNRDFTSSRSTEKVNPKDETDKSPSSPGQRSTGSHKDPHTIKDTTHADMDGDNLSVSSPYSRSYFGSTEDDRNNNNNINNKLNNNNNNNRHNRNMNMRNQGNWKNVPNWGTPMTPGGYIPFQHVPPPMFHPLMQQFPPPMFGRPPMKLNNNPGLPYHVGDHGRALWREDSVPVPPPMHGWDGSSNPVFGVGDDSHLYGWDRMGNRNNRGWSSQSQSQSQNVMDVVQSGGEKVSEEESEQSQMDVPEASVVVSEGEKVGKRVEMFEEENERVVSNVYLERVDVSEELSISEVYDECTSMMMVEPLSDEFECKILFLEEEGDVSNGNMVFAATNDDSVFQKAMLLYKKQKEELNGDKKTTVCDDDGGKKPMEEEMTVKENVAVNEEEGIKSMEVDSNVVAVKQEQVELPLEDKEKEKVVDCKVEEDWKNGGESIESNEIGSVNLSRIHDNHSSSSPEKSTH